MMTVTFSNGYTVREQIITISDELRRLSFTAINGRASHHNSYFQVSDMPEGNTRIVWVTDLLPDDIKAPIVQMVESGSVAIQQTLERLLKGA